MIPDDYPQMAVDEWVTPVSHIPAQSVGNMHIVKRVIPAGTTLDLYPDSERGVVFQRDTELTILRHGSATATDTESVWMSDTPMEYFLAWELVSRIRPPRVLVVGLGLGLLVHLIALRRDVTHIDVIEIDRDIIHMVKPYLPKHKGLEIQVFNQDFFDLDDKHPCVQTEYDTVIGDIWKSGIDKKSKKIMLDFKRWAEQDWMNARVLVWAFQKEHEEVTAARWYLWNVIKQRKL